MCLKRKTASKQGAYLPKDRVKFNYVIYIMTTAIQINFPTSFDYGLNRVKDIKLFC